MTVGERGEHELLTWIRQRVPVATASAGVAVGIGDDAAVLVPRRGEWLVQTTDALVEGTHFDRRWSSPHDLGRRAVAVNLSDLAAMAARPAWLLLSIVMPATLPVDDFEAIVAGALAEAQRAGASLVGGNLTQSSGPLVIDVTATGHVRPRRVLRRDQAHAGDELWVTGAVGGAAAGLEMLRDGLLESNPCVDRYRAPTPRLRESWAVAAEKASRAAIDVSDGLAVAVRQLAAASGVGARIDSSAVPVDAAARRWFDRRGVAAVTAALGASDDYELLFAVPPRARGRLRAVLSRTATPFTRIGVLTKDRACVLVSDGADVPMPGGFAHFTQP